MRDGFIFYRSFFEAAQGLEPSDRISFYDALTSYCFDGVILEDISPVAKALFLMAKPQIDANEKRRTDGQKGGRPPKKPLVMQNEKPLVIECENHTSVDEKPKEKEKEKEKGKEKVKDKRFIPPTIEEVRAYCKERGNNVDPERFVDFYASKDWMIGKNRMKDFRAAVRTWEKSEKPQAKKGPYFDLNQRQYDYKKLEQMVLRR